jgi:hypothetical protein
MKIDKQKFATELLEHIPEFGVYSVAISEDADHAITAFIKDNDTNYITILQATARGISATYLNNSATRDLKDII